MRTDLELWLIVEENFDKYFNCSLCEVVYKLREFGIISGLELNFLITVIRKYGVKRFGFNDYELWTKHYWNIGHKKPRINFVQKQILKAIRKPDAANRT